MMTEEQKELEGLLLNHISNQVANAVIGTETIATTALALIELWKITGQGLC